MADCELIGTVKDVTGTANAPAGTTLTLVETRIPGVAHTQDTSKLKRPFYVDATGTLKTKTRDGAPAKVARGAYAKFSGPVRGFHQSSGAWVQIPDAATVDINVLADNADTSPPPRTSVSETTFNATVADLRGQIDSLGAGASIAVFEIDADATLDVGDAKRALVLIDTTAGDVTATLQPLADMAGREVTFKKIADDNTAHVDGDAMELIDGRLLFDLEMLHSFVSVVPAAGEWRVTGKG